jgi:hypothetical protein
MQSRTQFLHKGIFRMLSAIVVSKHKRNNSSFHCLGSLSKRALTLCNTPPAGMIGVNQDLIEGFLMKWEFTSTCIHVIIIVFRISNLLQFKCSNSIHQISCSGIINHKRKLILSTIHRRHHALRHRPQQQSMPMAPPSTGSNRQESRPPTGSHPWHHLKGEKSYLHTII